MTQKKPIRILALGFGIIMSMSLLIGVSARAIPEDIVPGSTLQQRVDQRVNEFSPELDAKLQVRLASRCVATQSVARTLQDQLNPIVINRSKTYQKIDAKIWIAIGQLKLAERDTFNLEKQRAELAAKVALFNSTASQYRQTLDDISVMDCKADLEGFVALIEAAREYHEEIRKQITDIKSYTVDTIKTSLTDFSSALQPKAATEQESE